MNVQDNQKSLPVPKRIGDLSALFGYVVLCAPSRFPENGFFNNDQSRLLQENFKRLLLGLPLANGRLKSKDQVALVKELLSKSLHAYEAQDKLLGSRLLQQAGHLIWPSKFSR
jgi:hypothetical protein